LDVDFRDYLPFDSAREMRAALDALQPRALVFSKLDVWPELVRQTSRRHIPIGMISATLAAASGRRSRAANLLLGDAYERLDAVGAIDQADADRLIELGVRREVVEVTGDTRFDQVWERAENADPKSGLLARLASRRPTLVAGSTWPTDETRLLDAIAGVRGRVRNLRVILAPHEPVRTHLEPIERWAAARQLTHAHVDEDAARNADVVLVDRFGVLGDLYALADVAFVGGGFHAAGLHSVLEPAAYGAPVIFGPRHDRSRDAVLLLKAGGAIGVSSAPDIVHALLNWFENAQERRAAGARARRVIEDGRGAAKRSVALIERLMGLTMRT
jgi:3-deoxy-D-manno-octulosonic-acid transferase